MSFWPVKRVWRALDKKLVKKRGIQITISLRDHLQSTNEKDEDHVLCVVPHTLIPCPFLFTSTTSSLLNCHIMSLLLFMLSRLLDFIRFWNLKAVFYMAHVLAVTEIVLFWLRFLSWPSFVPFVFIEFMLWWVESFWEHTRAVHMAKYCNAKQENWHYLRII